MASAVRQYTKKPSTSECQDASLIVLYAHQTAASMLKAFTDVRAARKAKGTTTDDEQDLLRSMLVFALAGLDSSAKRVARDALPALASRKADVRNALAEFSARKLRGLGETTESNRFLVKLLMHDKAETALLDEFIDDLTHDSLQSVDELHKLGNVLGVTSDDFKRDVQQLREAFSIRNKIIHEMDMDLDSRNRNRASRTRYKMVQLTNGALSVSELLVSEVDRVLSDSAAT